MVLRAFSFVLSALCLFSLGCSSEPPKNSGGGGSGTSSSSSGAGGQGGTGGAPITYPAAYSIQAFDNTRITSDSNQPNFQRATADIELHDGPFASVKLSVDLSSTCYPFDKWKTNAPPAGQNWPADCDAFDRNFEFLLDEPADPAKDPPAFELVRAITPFGGPLHLDIDITDVANGIAAGQHKLTVVIPTWSDGAGQVSGSNGGWNVSASIEAVPGAPPRKVLAAIPLFNGIQSQLPGPGAISFETPANTKSARLEYRVTGHGSGDEAGDAACIGPAEEFCRRTHVIYADGNVLDSFKPWRTDCADLCTITHYAPWNIDYCLENPCGAIPSVQAYRANWCPGSVTPPMTWDLAPLNVPGSHTFEWTINKILPGGSWRISAVYFAFGE